MAGLFDSGRREAFSGSWELSAMRSGRGFPLAAVLERAGVKRKQ